MRAHSGSISTRLAAAVAAVAVVVLAPGCRRGEAPPAQERELTRIILQTDWFPQPEHGGFYQALAQGYYREAGLDVEILPGGPNAMSTQKILKGTAHFAMNRADMVYSLACRDVPILMVMATLQHDPQAVLLHADNPINRLQDLDGQRVMAVPGLSWIKWLEAKYGIRLNIVPHDFGLERFINDPSFIQQCLLTNEPFYAQQAGVRTKVLPLSESGFDPYHGVYCLSEFAEANPEIVQAFVAASIRGWRDFILHDPSPALEQIAARNPRMNAEFMAFCMATLKERDLVTGSAPDGSEVGALDPQRLEQMAAEMRSLGLVEDGDGAGPAWYTTRFVRPADGPAYGHP